MLAARMTHRNWNEDYEKGDAPWDAGAPDPHLVSLVGSGRVAPGRTLEIGCGTGTNALWLATQGFDVIGVDVAQLAIDKARAKAAAAGAVAGACRFELLDFLAAAPPGGPFDLVFDRGCFHVFDDGDV